MPSVYETENWKERALKAEAALSHVQAPAAPVQEELRNKIIDIVREKYDPTPSDWYAKDAHRWDDGTGDIADAILALVAAPSRDDVVRECIAVVEAEMQRRQYYELAIKHVTNALRSLISGDTSNG